MLSFLPSCDEVKGQIYHEYGFEMQTHSLVCGGVKSCCEINITTVAGINMCQIRYFQVSLQN